MNRPKITDFSGELRTENGHHIWHSAESQYFEALEKYNEVLEKALELMLYDLDMYSTCKKCIHSITGNCYDKDCNEGTIEYYKQQAEKELENDSKEINKAVNY